MSFNSKIYILEPYFLNKTAYINFFNSHNDENRIIKAFDTPVALNQEMSVCPAEIVMIKLDLSISNGLEFLYQLKKNYPETSIIVISSLKSEKIVKASLALKASAFVFEETPLEKIAEIISKVMNGERWVEAKYSDLLKIDILPFPLSFNYDNLYPDNNKIELNLKGRLL